MPKNPHGPESEYVRFDADSFCIVHLRPNSDVVQVMSNVADEHCAKMYARQIELDGGHVFAAVPAGALVGALQYIRPGKRLPHKAKNGRAVT